MVWGTFISTFALLTEEGWGGAKATWAMPFKNQHISKRGFPNAQFKFSPLHNVPVVKYDAPVVKRGELLRLEPSVLV